MNDSQTVVEKVEAIIKGVKAAAKKTHPTARAMHPEQLQQTIAVAAYYLAERRNFEPGHEMEDWLNAEAQVKAQVEGLKGFPA